MNPIAVATCALCVALITAGVHSFARWLSADPSTGVASAWRLRSTLALVGGFVLAFTAAIAAVGIAHQTTWLFTSPGALFRSSSKHGAESSAIGALKTVATARSIFRESDKEQDGSLDYGTLDELSETQLGDAILGNGLKQGYRFEACPSVTTPEFLWFATAAPVSSATGDRFFFASHAGIIDSTVQGGPPRVDRSTCEPPPGWFPVGK